MQRIGRPKWMTFITALCFDNFLIFNFRHNYQASPTHTPFIYLTYCLHTALETPGFLACLIDEFYPGYLLF